METSWSPCHSYLLASVPHSRHHLSIPQGATRHDESDAERLNLQHMVCVCECVSVCADCKCVCMYLGVESLCILGDSVELWETEHVLLAARPIKYPQSERGQCSKYLHHTQDTAI